MRQLKVLSCCFALTPIATYAVVLIGNYPGTGTSVAVGANCNVMTYRAMSFTTPGYPTQLTTVRVRTAVSNALIFPNVEFRTGVSASSPGTVVHTMIPPATYPTGVRDRTYTTAGFTFQPNTTYSIVVRNSTETGSVGSWYRSDPQFTPTGLATHGVTRITYNNSTFTTDSLMGMYEINVANPTQFISGFVSLADTVSPLAAIRQVQYSVVQGTTTLNSGTMNTTISTSSLSIGVPASTTGPVSIRFDGSSFLRRVITVNLGGTGASIGTVVMQNGDVDNSGEVDAADIDAVIAAFGSTAIGTTDVDVSGEVDAADIDIVIANFGGVDE